MCVGVCECVCVCVTKIVLITILFRFVPFSKEELNAVLKFGAEDLFKETVGDDKALQVCIVIGTPITLFSNRKWISMRF